MSMTDPTFHAEISMLKDEAPMNILRILLTLPTADQCRVKGVVVISVVVVQAGKYQNSPFQSLISSLNMVAVEQYTGPTCG